MKRVSWIPRIAGVVMLCADGVMGTDATLTLVPIGGANIQGGDQVAVEIFFQANRAYRLEFGLFDLPCAVSAEPGGTGTLTAISGCADCDGNGINSSSGGVPFLTGVAGLGPFAPATCVSLATYGSQPTILLNEGEIRYAGTVNYQVSPCAEGDFVIRFECTDQPDGLCDKMPEATNTTRAREDAPPSPAQGPLLQLSTLEVTLQAQCPPGADAECTVGVCDQDLNGGKGGCAVANVPDGTPCGSPLDTQCNDPDTCLNGVCVTNLMPAGTPCSNPFPGPCDAADTCLNGNCNPNLFPIGTPCGDPTSGPCDAPDTCGFGAVCLSNHAADGSPCVDESACTVNDVCAAGSCAAEPVECDDGLFCTGAESCDAELGCLPGDEPCAFDQACDEEMDLCVVLSIPTVSAWGLVVLTLALVCWGTVQARGNPVSHP